MSAFSSELFNHNWIVHKDCRISNFKLSPKIIVGISFLLWLFSLSLTGISTYSDKAQLLGYEILLMGWLSPLAFNFAWFANIFYLIGIRSVAVGKSVNISPILAVVLSFDTFRYSRHLLDEGGGSTQVYGYGWGAFVWLIAIFLLLIAAGFREGEEETDSNSPVRGQGKKVVGVILIVVTVFTTMTFSIYDRVIANDNELTYLSKVAFKRGSVCSAKSQIVLHPIKDFSGPLEIKLSSYRLHANYPFTQLETLLDWGIPSIRIDGRDYVLRSNNSKEITSRLSTGPAEAILEVNEISRVSIQAIMIETKSKRLIFDFTWKRQNYPVNTDIYCPLYSSLPKPEDLPRRFVIEALDLDKTNIRPVDNSKSNKVNFINVEIAQRSSGGLTKEMRLASLRKLKPLHPNRYHKWKNINCPDSIGWGNSRYHPLINAGTPFRINDSSYYLDSKHSGSICEEDAIYIHRQIAGNKDYTINIQKRSKVGFVKMWSGTIVIKGISLPHKNAFYIESVKETDGHVQIALVRKENGNIIVVHVLQDELSY